MTGDFYRSVQFPNIDRANGGSLMGLEDGLARVIALSGPNTMVVASGTSCRHQIFDLTNVAPKHMAEVFADAIS